MHSLFSRQSQVAQGLLKLPDWIYVKNGLMNSLSTIIKYHRLNPMAVHSNHFLVKLLQSITVPQAQNIERYYSNVDAMALNLSMALRMTSSISVGQIFDGIFFGVGNDEILIAHTESFDPVLATKDWKNLSPVRFLRHPRSDLGLNLPDGTNTGSEEGLVIVSINIPLLAVQYRAFRLNELMINENSDESTLSCSHFIQMYVLPNSMNSYLDHVIFNRIYNLEFGAPLGESKKRHPFSLNDYTHKVNYVHKMVLDTLQKQNKTFDGMLQNIPMVSKDNACELMELPDIPLTRQVLWALVMSRIPELSFLFRIANESIGDRNRSEVNRILRYIYNYKRDNLFRQALPLHLFNELMDDVDAIVISAK